MHLKRLRDFAMGAIIVAASVGVLAQPAKVRLALPATSLLFAPVYIAEDGGYFQDAGLDVDVAVLAGPAALNALVGGSGDMTVITGQIQLRAAQRGQKTLAIAGLQENATTEVVLSAATAERLSSSTTPIEKAKALKGLTLAVDAANGLPHSFLRYITRQAGVDADRDIKLVFISPAGMNAALQNKEIDGFAFSSPFTSEAIRRGARLWISPPRGNFPDVNPTAYSVLVARNGYCAGAAPTCRAVIGALERSMRLMASQPQDALTMLTKRFDKMDPELMKQAFETFQRNTPPRPLPLGRAFEHTVDVMFSPQDDKTALKALAKTLYTDEFLTPNK